MYTAIEGWYSPGSYDRYVVDRDATQTQVLKVCL